MMRLYLPEPPADSEEEAEEAAQGAVAPSSRSSIPMDAGNGGSSRALPPPCGAGRGSRPLCPQSMWSW